MPLKIIPPRNKKTTNFYIRGTYLGVSVDRSSGTDRRSVARKVLQKIEREIESGEFTAQALSSGQQSLTFVEAVRNYLITGHSPRYVAPLVRHFGETPIADIDQAAIDDAAAIIKPSGSPMNRNAAVHSPMSAILHHAGIDLIVRRPKGFKGRMIAEWLLPEDAFGIIAAADEIEPEFATLLFFLLYTGPRISAALELRREDVRLEEGRAWARSQKKQPHMDVRLREDLCERLRVLLASHDRQRVFRWHYGAHLAHLLTRAKFRFQKLPCPVRRPIGWIEPDNKLSWVTFHIFRHTWATWMRHAGTDVKGLVATGNWRSERSASRYAHAVPRDEWDRVEKLPSMGTRRGIA